MIGKGITRFHCVIWPAMLLRGGRGAAAPGLGPRLRAVGRRQDVEDGGHRGDAWARRSSGTAPTRCAISCCAKSASRPTATSPGSGSTSATPPIWRTGSATWPPARSRCWRSIATAWSRTRRTTLRWIRRDAKRCEVYARAMDALDLRGGAEAAWELVATANLYIQQSGAVEAGQGGPRRGAGYARWRPWPGRCTAWRCWPSRSSRARPRASGPPSAPVAISRSSGTRSPRRRSAGSPSVAPKPLPQAGQGLS